MTEGIIQKVFHDFVVDLGYSEENADKQIMFSRLKQELIEKIKQIEQTRRDAYIGWIRITELIGDNQE